LGAAGTSLIVTAGATATRAADLVTFTNAALAILSGNQGTVYFKSGGSLSSLSNRVLLDRDGAGNFLMQVAPSTAVRANANNTLVSATLGSGGNWTVGANNYAAVGWDGTGVAINGNNGVTATTTATFTGTVSSPQLGGYGGSAFFINGYVSEVAFWTSKLPHMAVANTIDAIGDSFTFNTAYGDLPSVANFYPAVVANQLNAAGGRVAPKNYGVAGNTTTQMVARMSSIPSPVLPGIAIIYGGNNDMVGTDDTTANIISMGTTFAGRGYPKMLIIGMHYSNRTSGIVDTVSAQDIQYGPIRTRQQNAQASLAASFPGVDVRYVDLYSCMRALIVAGTYT
jgi:hypothetical protein